VVDVLTDVAKVSAFLQTLARDIDLEKISSSDDGYEGHVVRQQRHPLKPQFEPMRRKLQFPSSS